MAKREELIQQIVGILRSQFRLEGDAAELRAIIAAEKIVKRVIEPTVKSSEQSLHYLYKRRTSVFDS